MKAGSPETVWMLHTRRADFKGLAACLGIDQVTARVLVNRGLRTQAQIERFLSAALDDLGDPGLVRGLPEAADLLLSKIRAGRKIRIVGDYDIDGVCAAFILFSGLVRCGASADWRIPERVRDGYGVSEQMIREAAADGIDTVLTCDNGIAAHAQIALAKQLGLTVIVTDHHEVPVDADGKQKLPPADIVADPKQDGCPGLFREICGAMIAWKLVQLLCERAGLPASVWRQLLVFAAIATVGDVMPLIDENRIVVRYGLRLLQHTENAGLQALLKVCGLTDRPITAWHIGFVLGPCLNAGGRLRTAALAMNLFLSTDEKEAQQLAEELCRLNEERKRMTQEGFAQAMVQAGERCADDPVLVLVLPDCHESVAGIIAGRVREALNRPALVLTKSGKVTADGRPVLKGSGRSTEGWNMYQALNGVSDLLVQFGGHKAAAGLLIAADNVDALRRRLNSAAASLKPEKKTLWIDVPMPVSYVTEKLTGELARLAPFGQGNARPLFAEKGLSIRRAEALGRKNNAVRLLLQSRDGHMAEALYFTEADSFLAACSGCGQIDIAYWPEIDEYRGRRRLQIRIEDCRLR